MVRQRSAKPLFPSSNLGVASNLICRGGGTGRRTGLKIPRIVISVPVRFRSSAPFLLVTRRNDAFFLLKILYKRLWWNGRHTILRGWRWEACGFKSHQPHQKLVACKFYCRLFILAIFGVFWWNFKIFHLINLREYIKWHYCNLKTAEQEKNIW